MYSINTHKPQRSIQGNSIQAMSHQPLLSLGNTGIKDDEKNPHIFPFVSHPPDKNSQRETVFERLTTPKVTEE